jgi:alpha-beta hydrolase superfamily lysophospholipase
VRDRCHVASIDHAGHGRSEGLPMLLQDFERHLVADVSTAIDNARKALDAEGKHNKSRLFVLKSIDREVSKKKMFYILLIN